MSVLPIKFLTSYDKDLFGEDLINLSNLSRLGLPVAWGYAVSVPEEIYTKTRKDSSKSNILFLKEQFKKNPMLGEILENVKDKKITQKMWNDLIDKWFKVLEIELEKSEKIDFKNIDLKAQSVYIAKNVECRGSAFLNKNTHIVEVETQEGKLSSDQQIELERLVALANSKLLLDYVYDWIIDKGEIKFVKLRPFTPTLENLAMEMNAVVQADSAKHNLTALKIFKYEDLNFKDWIEIDTPSDVLKIEGYMDSEKRGFLINLDKISGHLHGSEQEVLDPQVVKSFFEKPIKEVVSGGGLVLFGGDHTLDDDILKFLIRAGIYGIVIEKKRDGLDENIQTIERMNVSGLLD